MQCKCGCKNETKNSFYYAGGKKIVATYIHGHNRRNEKQVKCLMCNTLFSTVESKHKKFCSRKCVYDHLRVVHAGKTYREYKKGPSNRLYNRTSKSCIQCNTVFFIPNSRVNASYCSLKCRNRAYASNEKYTEQRHNFAHHRYTRKGKKTIPELKFEEINKKHNMGYNYTGDYSFWIDNVNPDFVNREKKIALEILGCYWHGCPWHNPSKWPREEEKINKRINIVTKNGWKIVGLWEHVLNLCSEEVTHKMIKIAENYTPSWR